MTAGIAEIAVKVPSAKEDNKHPAGRWSMTTFAGRQVTLGELAIDDGFLRVRRPSDGGFHGRSHGGFNDEFEDEFVGFAAPLKLGSQSASGYLAQSPIGSLQIGNCPVQERTSSRNRTMFQSRHAAGSSAAGAPGTLQSCSVPLRLFACSLSLPGADDSQFTFNAAALHALWCPARADIHHLLGGLESYLWIGSLASIKSLPVMKLDLSRARLAATRSSDLLEVAFLFADLWLQIRQGKIELVPPASSYRVLQREIPSPSAITQNSGEREDILDTRPVLVVEFPPQHVFEEAIFKTASSDLPEVRLLKDDKTPATEFQVPGMDPLSTDPVTLIDQISKYDRSTRIAIRKELARQKIEQEGSGLFQKLHDRLPAIQAEDRNWKKMDDQFIYIGPYGMDPDVRARARRELAQIVNDQYNGLSGQWGRAASHFFLGVINPGSRTAKLLAQANDLAEKLNDPGSYRESNPSILAFARSLLPWPHDANNATPNPPLSPADAILHEQAIAALLPGYDLFRDYYREEMTRKWMKQPTNEQASGAPEYLDFFSLANRGWASDEQKKSMGSLQTEMTRKYDLALAIEPEPKAIMRARLANPSRLAFRLNPEPGKTIGFHLTCLLDWQSHELAVSPRARAVTPYDLEGRPPLPEEPAIENDSLGADFQKLSQSQASDGNKGEDQKDPAQNTAQETSTDTKQETAALSGAMEDLSTLRSLGFHLGETVTAEQRLTDVEASLRSPGLLETAIELPARLILSPSQTAKWRVPWTPLTNGPSHLLPVDLRPLWSVELVTEPVDPAVRAIFSPDLRPGFVRQTLERAAAEIAKSKNSVSLSIPTGAPPPRGPRAPWTLGIEDGGPKPSTSAEVATQLGVTLPPPMTDKAVASKPDPQSSDETLPPLVRYLRRREYDHNSYKNSALFRSALDAYDRHEIVILSSAYGLPVSGKRDAAGKLLPISISSQAEAPDMLQPIDLMPGSALYRPRPLKIKELRLSALGGTLRHDTDFVPPTAADHLVYGPLHDSLSVERWQHWVVLGRDVFAEVVYKGFLFPIGHRASLVKQTERIFLRANLVEDENPADNKTPKPARNKMSKPATSYPGGSVRAYLQQRIFIRIGEPLKAFPALGQPNRGRQFPPRSVLLLTTVTPDLVDPSLDDPQASQDDDAPNSAGRLLLKLPGLVFWPRTARIAGSEVRFEALVDASFVKLPLIFVDNIAAQNDKTLSALAQYYNNIPTPDSDTKATPSLNYEISPHQHLRTLDLQQQSLRYCDEVKPASASHRTLYWNLKASGGSDTVTPADATLNIGEGKNTRFHNSALDGADQPSFYPALESARIRLDQVERMSANKTAPAVVEYDGHYLRFGFPANSADRPSDQKASQQSASPSVDPAIVVSKDQQAVEEARQKEADKNQLEIYLNVTSDVSFGMGAAGDRSGGVFQPGGGVAALSRMRGPLGGPPRSSESKSLVDVFQDPRTAYQSHFTSKSTPDTGILDTKLLGILSLKDVVNFCKQFRPAAEGLPQLQEVLTYGASASGATEQTLRTNIIQPLLSALAELNNQWQKVDQQLEKAQEENHILLAVRLSDIFPELSRAKGDFAAALGATQSLTDVAFLTSLGDVYETGLRLENALEQASTHTPERSFLAVANAFPSLLIGLFNVDSIRTTVLSSIVNKVVNGQAGSAAPPDIHRATEYLASLALDDDAFLHRFFPASGGLKGAAAEALRSKRQQLIEFLNHASTMAAALAGQFAQALRAEPALAALAEPWASTALPLFEVAGALSQAAAAPDDPQKWAAAASVVFTDLWPLPETLRCSERKFLAGVNDILDQLDAITKGVEDAWKAAGNFHPSSDNIQLPPYCKPNRITGNPAKTAADLCSFAAAAQFALPSVWDSRGRAYLIGAANAALRTEEQVLMLARLLAQLGKGYRPPRIVDVNPVFLTSVFDQVQRLMEAVANALRFMLPNPLPPLQEVQKPPLEILAHALHAGISFLLTCQKSALDLTNAWVDKWVNSITDGTTLAALQQQISANTARLKSALDAADQPGSWPAWTQVERDAVIPLPDDLFLKLTQQGAQYLKLGWSQVLTPGEELESKFVNIAKPIFTSLAKFYEDLFKERGDLLAKYPETKDAVLIPPDSSRNVTTVKVGPDLTPSTDQLFYDKQALANLRSDSTLPATDPAYYQFLRQFLSDWASGNDTPHLIVKRVQQSLSLESARARLLAIVDFSRLRDQIDHAVKQLIPHSSELTYAFDIALETDAVQKASVGFCIPQAGCNLTITSKTKIDFETGKTEFHSVGDLGPFDIKLLGAIADAITLKFEGVHFESGGGPPTCDVHFHSVVMGPMFKFLEQLQKFLSPKKGSGFYLIPLAEGVGIEAGYGLNLGTISFGNVSFANVALNAAARLPFDSHQATFTAGLSRRDAPFTISIAPYGGAGFFLIEASAQGVTAFEASFEYGGAAAFQYGPLQGQGRVMVGVYIRIGKGGKIAATFFAGGAASLWIFSFSASLYITAESNPGDSAIVGTATFTFSFSIGFIDYDFSVKAQQRLEWGGKKDEHASLSQPQRPPGFEPRDSTQVAMLRADTWCQSEHWGRHLEHFDMTLAQDEEVFV